MALNSFGIASTIFLILYLLDFCFLIYNYSTRRFKFKSKWSLLLFHVTLRLSAQAVGIAFSIIGFKDVSLLIASLILSAEGYFSLCLCVARLMISWQRRYSQEKYSWLAGKPKPKEMNNFKKFFLSFSILGILNCPINAIHWILIIGNALIITGGNLLASGKNNESVEQNWNTNSNLKVSKILRGTGQGLFFLMVLFLYGTLFFTIKKAFRKSATKKEIQSRNYLIILAFTTPFMFARGIFGILQSVLDQLNYYYPGIYNDSGFTTEFVIKEAILTTMDEWITCTLLLSTSLLRSSRKENIEKEDHDQENQKSKESSRESMEEEK